MRTCRLVVGLFLLVFAWSGVSLCLGLIHGEGRFFPYFTSCLATDPRFNSEGYIPYLLTSKIRGTDDQTFECLVCMWVWDAIRNFVNIESISNCVLRPYNHVSHDGHFVESCISPSFKIYFKVPAVSCPLQLTHRRLVSATPEPTPGDKTTIGDKSTPFAIPIPSLISFTIPSCKNTQAA